jgi:hypothetical protein
VPALQIAPKKFDQRGFAIVGGVLEQRETATAARALDRFKIRGVGTRRLLDHSWCRALVQRVKTRLANAGILPPSFVATQCTVFDKTPARNWLVALHQDLCIPVLARVDHPSWGPWSKKEGVQFVQAPAKVLERLIAVRVHLDDCGFESGPLRVVPASHCAGLLSDADAVELRATLGEVVCTAKSGDALIIRPLLLHSSSKAQSPSRRRVLHVLFGPPALPDGLQWKQAV